jgi:gentisate 1,2-dioxygenase
MGYPQVRWPWRTVRRALATLASSAAADTPVILRYVDPTTGRPPMLTLGAEAQWLRPGETTRRERRTAAAIFHVIEGRGESRVGEDTFAWEQGDTFVAPAWHWIEHGNRSAAPACVFQFNDEPAVRALGLWHEDVAAH